MANPKKIALIKPSTRAFISEARKTPGFTLSNWLHGYFYARWTYLYLRIGRGDHWLVRIFGPALKTLRRLFPARNRIIPQNGSGTIADGYHGKVMPLETAKRLVQVNEDIHITDLERVIPYPKARDIILQNPQHIVVLECPCRSGRVSECHL